MLPFSSSLYIQYYSTNCLCKNVDPVRGKRSCHHPKMTSSLTRIWIFFFSCTEADFLCDTSLISRNSRFNWGTKTCLYPTVWPHSVIPAHTAIVQCVLLHFSYLKDFRHISSIGAGAGKKGTCRFLSSDDIMHVWTGQIKPKNTIIQEQALLCKSFLGHLVCWACTRGGCRRMKPIQ